MSDIRDITLFSFSHRNTSLEDRDRLAFSTEDVRQFVPRAREGVGGEIAVLSTCNRTEFYVYGPPRQVSWDGLRGLVAQIKTFDLSGLASPDHFHGNSAARHLFRVAASMESLALGEDQILSQVKEVHSQIVDLPEKSPVLDRLYQYAIRAGKRVRTETSLCAGAVSISSASVELARKIFGDFADLEILLVGAGETSEHAAEHFKAGGANSFVVCNRGERRGKDLADRFHGVYRPLSEIEQACLSADIVVLATGSPEYLLTKRQMKAVMKARGYRSLFVIDISNPRNCEPSVSGVSGVFLFNIDDLDAVIADNLKHRQKEIPQAEQIVDEVLAEWDLWMQTLRVRPTIAGLAKFFDEIRLQELDRQSGKLRPDELALLDGFSRSLVKKLLHNPIMFLRNSVENNTLKSEDLDLVWSLYKLDDSSSLPDE